MTRFAPAIVVAAFVTAVAQAASAHPLAAAGRCTTSADVDVRAIPSGYEDGTTDVFAKGVPRSAKRIRVRFVHAANGRPIGPDAFPLQSWSSAAQGFRPDGSYWLQIRLEGYGYGMPAARSSRWRALVSYDC